MELEKFFLKRLRGIATSIVLVSLACPLTFSAAQAADYRIDTKGMHASIQFKIRHLGFSWMLGRFDRFSGTFSYDPKKISESSIRVSVETASIDSNHAERDKHLRGRKFLETKKYPEATFVSTAFRDLGDGKMEVQGRLNLRGKSRLITIMAEFVGMGADPWGGHRVGFTGTTQLSLADFGIDYRKLMSETSQFVDMELNVEGVRK